MQSQRSFQVRPRIYITFAIRAWENRHQRSNRKSTLYRRNNVENSFRIILPGFSLYFYCSLAFDRVSINFKEKDSIYLTRYLIKMFTGMEWGDRLPRFDERLKSRNTDRDNWAACALGCVIIVVWSTDDCVIMPLRFCFFDFEEHP